MGLTLPFPNTPQNGQSGDATPINANFTAIAQAIQSFDGSQIAAGTIVASALNSTINPITRDNLLIKNFVSSGCVWSTVSGLSGTMTGGTIFINGIMVTVNGVVSHTFTVSQDTYIDVDYNGNVYYQGVSNNAASPSLTANSIRVAVVVTNGSAIASINQGLTSAVNPTVSSRILTVSDTLGNLIYPYSPDYKMLGYAGITSPFTNSVSGQVTVPGLSVTVNIPAAVRQIRVTARTSTLYNGSVNGQSAMTIWDGAVSVGTQVCETYASNSGNANQPGSDGAVASQILPVSAGTKTYNVGLTFINGSTAGINATTTSPAYLMVEAV